MVFYTSRIGIDTTGIHFKKYDTSGIGTIFYTSGIRTDTTRIGADTDTNGFKKHGLKKYNEIKIFDTERDCNFQK